MGLYTFRDPSRRHDRENDRENEKWMNRMRLKNAPAQAAAASIQPETITARSTDWPDIQLLLRSRPPGMVSLPHGQREHMIFCKSGRQEKSQRVRSVVRTEGRTREWRELPNQSVTFIPAKQPFDWEWTYHSQAIHLLMSPDALGRVAAQISGRPVPSEDLLPQLCIHDAFVAALLERLGRELMGEGYGTLLAAEATTNLLAVHLLHAYSGRPLTRCAAPDGLNSRQQARVLALMEERSEENIGLHEMADAVGLSAFHFARLFKRTFGVPPHEHQVQKRVERGRALLRARPDESVAQVAVALGFSDESHFRRHFKRLVGVTPSQYRREILK